MTETAIDGTILDMTDIAFDPAPRVPERFRAAIKLAADLAGQASAPATKAAYAADWSDWAGWCAEAGAEPLPALPAAVAAYLAEQSTTRAISTVMRRLATISTMHRHAGHPIDAKHPHIRAVLAGLRRTKGVAPKRARPATTGLVVAMVGTCDPTSLLGLRDRALLLVGFASALRRAELAALTTKDLDFTVEGVRLTIVRSKADQDGAGEVVGVMATGRPTCPVQALRAWLAAGRVTEGHVFRSVDRHGHVGDSLSGKAIRQIVQRRASLADLGPGLTAHSLRSGLITSAAAAGAAENDIARQSRHRSVAVLRGYVRHASVYHRNVSGTVGL